MQMPIASSDRRLVLVTLLLIAAVLSAPADVHAAKPEAVDRADKFLSSTKVGKDVLSFVHFGANYHGHSYLRTLNVCNAYGDPKPGYFALVYRFQWEDDGVTDVAFLCDQEGEVYQSQILATNAIIQQPFLAANAAIDILGRVVIGLSNDRLSDADRRAIQRAINAADAKSLMEIMLVVRQAN